MRAKDVMRSEVQCVSETTTLRELSRAFRRHGVTTLSVINDQEELVGVVTEAELLKACCPAMPNCRTTCTTCRTLSTWKTGPTRSRTCRCANIMLRGAISVNENTPLMRVISLFLLKATSHIPVVREDKIVGVVTRTDICELMFD